MNYSHTNNLSSMYNGRVNVIKEPEDPYARIKMFEKISLRNRPVNMQDSLEGIWESNVLSQVYFSAENVQIIQNGIRAGVYRMSDGKYVIPPQNIDALKIIMRSMYLQYAKHYRDNITEQVRILNQYVLDYCIPFVYNEAVSYVKYLQDQSTLVVPLEREIRPDRTYNQLVTNPFI